MAMAFRRPATLAGTGIGHSFFKLVKMGIKVRVIVTGMGESFT